MKSKRDELVELLNSKINKNRESEVLGDENAFDLPIDEKFDYFEKYEDDETGCKMVFGNGYLLSTDEDVIEEQADEMEESYNEMEIDGVLIYYICDPNA
jgi:hypothetical protein